MKKGLPPGLLAFFLCMSVLATTSAFPQTTETITERDVRRQKENTFPTSRWVFYIRPGTPSIGAFISGPDTPPLGGGSLLLSTATTNDKITLFNFDHITTRLSEIDSISYFTYRLAGTANQLAAINLTIDYNGLFVPGGFTTLVFEPAYNLNQQSVQNNTWQQWKATGSAVWWSTQPINGQCAGAAAACRKSWDYIVANNPNAVIIGGVGINQGSGNPGLTTSVDAFTFDETTYNFDAISDKDGDGVQDENDCDPSDPGNNLVVVCHEGKAICVSQSELRAHLLHGDKLGRCARYTTTVNAAPADAKNLAETAATAKELLLANHPNPFAGTTRIQYQLLTDSRVSLVVYDITGKEVKVLVNADQKSGSYGIVFNASALSNGVYYYRLTVTGNGKVLTQTRSMILAQ